MCWQLIYQLIPIKKMLCSAMFGGNKSKAYDHFETAMKLFKKESPKSDIHPGWGKDQTTEALQKCK